MAKSLAWSTFAGGTSAAEGKHGYSVRTEVGEYHISPVSTQYGRHRGYLARFANTRGVPGITGLWSGIGDKGEPLALHAERIYRSPQAAKKAARLHYEAIVGMLRGRGIVLNPYSKKARYKHKRLRSPRRFAPESLRLTRERKGVRVVVGRLKGERRRVKRGARKGRPVFTAQAVLKRKRNRAASPPYSERQAWQAVKEMAARIARGLKGQTGFDELEADALIMGNLAEYMLDQLGRGVHKNPMLAVFGNPPKGAVTGSDDIQAILYRHKEDGRDYVHPFGQGVKVQLKRDGSTVIRAAANARSGVRAIGLPNGSVLLRHPTKPIWRDF